MQYPPRRLRVLGGARIALGGIIPARTEKFEIGAVGSRGGEGFGRVQRL